MAMMSLVTAQQNGDRSKMEMLLRRALAFLWVAALLATGPTAQPAAAAASKSKHNAGAAAVPGSFQPPRAVSRNAALRPSQAGGPHPSRRSMGSVHSLRREFSTRENERRRVGSGTEKPHGSHLLRRSDQGSARGVSSQLPPKAPPADCCVKHTSHRVRKACLDLSKEKNSGAVDARKLR